MNKPLVECTNNEYHENRTHLSSSNLKQILTNIEKFHQEWVLGVKLREQRDVFDIGSLTHSLILEPDLVEEQYAFYTGLRRAGNAYNAFKEANPGKTVLTVAQKLKTEKYVEAYKARHEAVNMLQGGVPEHTMTGRILGVDVKARADYINIDAGYIVDVKTTDAPSDIDAFRFTKDQYMYDLSAALYCDIAKECYKKPFQFFFIVISKSDLICDIYKVSEETMIEGRNRVIQAIQKYKRCKESNIWFDLTPAMSYDSITDYEIREV
jgi:hypothetical protein